LSFNYHPSSYQSLEASLSSSASRSTAGPIVFLLDRNKPVTALDNTVTPTTLRQLTLSIEDLESQKEAAVHSELSDMEQGQGGSNYECS